MSLGFPSTEPAQRIDRDVYRPRPEFGNDKPKPNEPDPIGWVWSIAHIGWVRVLHPVVLRSEPHNPIVM